MADKLVIKIDGDDSGLEKRLKGIGNVAQSALGVAVKGAAAVSTAFAGATVAALKFSGEFEQNLGGSEAVFKEFASTIQETANKAYKNMGLSASDYMATANKMGALFQGVGFTIGKSADISAQAMQRAADVASIMGLDVGAAMEAVAGAAKGNFTMMDNLGVAMNDTTLQAYAQANGLGELKTTYDKVNAAMMMFLEKTEYAAGNYAKENETLAGSLTTLKAAFENFMAGVGSAEELEEALTSAMDVVVKNIEELTPALAEGLIQLVHGLIPVIPEIIRQLIPGIIDTIEELFFEVIDVIPDLVSEIADGVGDAVPVLKPLASLISALADNIETLASITAVGTSAFVAYKTALLAMSVIQQVTSWLNTTRTALTAYTTALAVNSATASTGATVNGLLLMTLTPLQTVYGVLTGKIKLADAAQKLLNSTILKNPYALAAAALAALITAIVAYAATHTSVSEEIQNSLEDIRTSYEDAIKAIDDAQSAELAEAEVAKTLKNELYNLESQIKSGTLSQEEAEKAQTDFNTAAAKLEEIIPGITDCLYDETGEINIQKQAVDELATSYYDLAVAKAMANAYQEKMNEAAKALVDAKETQKTAQANYDNQNSYYKIDTDGNPNTHEGMRWGLVGSMKVTSAKDALEEADGEVEKYTDSLANFTKEWQNSEAEIKNLIGNVTTETKNGDDEVTKTVTAGNATRTKDTKTALETDLNNLQKAHKYGVISDKEYYLELAKLRNKYFKEGSDDWDEYTEEIFDYYNDMLSEAKDAALAQLEEIGKAQDAMAKKLHESSNLTYEQYSIVEKGEETAYTRLADVGASNRKLEQYNNLLDRVYEKRPELPDNFTGFLSDMDVDEAITYLNELLTASEAEFNKYMFDLEENQRLSKEVSSKVYSSEFKELAEKFKDEFGQLPEDFFEIGEESAEQYGEGFMNQLKNVFEDVRARISAEMKSLSSQLAIAGAGNVTTNTFTDARTTNIYASSASPHEIIEEQKQNEIYQQHTSKWGGK